MVRLEDAIKQTRPFNNVHHKASVNLIFTGKWIIQKHSEFFHRYDLTLQQYNVLRILKGIYPTSVTIKYIRKRMLDKMSDASRIVDTMYNRGLVLRGQNSKDRRKVDVIISDKGLELFSKIDKNNHTLDHFLSNLNTKETEELNFLLDKLRN